MNSILHQIVDYQEEYCFDSKPGLEDVCPVLSELQETSINYIGEIEAAVETLDDIISRFELEPTTSVTKVKYELRVRINKLKLKFDVEIGRRLTRLSTVMIGKVEEEIVHASALRARTPNEKREIEKSVEEAKSDLSSASRIKDMVKKTVPVINAIGKILPILVALF